MLLWTLAAALGAERALAEEPPGAVTSYGFEDEQVLGDQVAPNGHLLHARTRAARESLVQARLHFVRELCRSVEAL